MKPRGGDGHEIIIKRRGKKGGHDAVHVATLSTKPTLDHGDFGIV